MRKVVRRTQQRESFKYQFSLDKLSLSPLGEEYCPPSSYVQLQFARATKVVSTEQVSVVNGMATWEKAPAFLCTVYESKKAERSFSEKEFRVSLLVISAGKRPREVASSALDVASFATLATPETVFSDTIPLTSRAKKKENSPILNFRITSTQMGVGFDDDESVLQSAAESRASDQDLSGFDDTRSEKSEGESDISGMSSPRKGAGAARRDATLAELRELKANIESQAKGTVVSESAEAIALKAEVESLRTELVEAHIKEAQARMKFHNVEAELKREKDSKAQVGGDRDGLQQALEDAEKQFAGTKEQMLAAKEEAEADKSRALKSLEALELKNKELQKELQSHSIEMANMTYVQEKRRTEVTELKMELASLQSEFKEAKVTAAEAKTSRDQAEGECERLGSSISALEGQLEEEKAGARKLTSLLEKAKTKMSELSEELEEAKAVTSQLSLDLEEVKAGKEKISIELETAKEKVASMLAKEANEVAELAKEQSMAHQAASEIASLKEELSRYQSSLEKEKAAVDEARSEAAAAVEREKTLLAKQAQQVEELSKRQPVAELAASEIANLKEELSKCQLFLEKEKAAVKEAKSEAAAAMDREQILLAKEAREIAETSKRRSAVDLSAREIAVLKEELRECLSSLEMERLSVREAKSETAAAIDREKSLMKKLTAKESEILTTQTEAASEQATIRGEMSALRAKAEEAAVQQRTAAQEALAAAEAKCAAVKAAAEADRKSAKEAIEAECAAFKAAAEANCASAVKAAMAETEHLKAKIAALKEELKEARRQQSVMVDTDDETPPVVSQKGLLQDVARLQAEVHRLQNEAEDRTIELRSVQEQLTIAIEDGGRAASAARVAEQLSEQLRIKLDEAKVKADQTSLSPTEADSGKEAERAAELRELQLLLVDAKIQVAELEYKKEYYRCKAWKASDKLKALGGDSLQKAQRSTKLELKLAKSMQDNLALREQNAALQKDVSSMIDLKLKVAEFEAG